MLVFHSNHSLHINISICQTTHRHTALHSTISSNTHSTMRLLKMFFFSPAVIPWRSLVWLQLVVVTQKSILNVSRDSIFFCVIAELTNIPPAQIDVRLGIAACTRTHAHAHSPVRRFALLYRYASVPIITARTILAGLV